MKKATCFLCYAWNKDESRDERYQKLDFLRKKIEEESNGLVEGVLDKHSFEVNADTEKLRNKIKKYHLVIVAFTPDLKQINQDRHSLKNKDREVLKELDLVIKRYKTNDISVFPLILEGDKDSSVFNPFDNKTIIPNFGDFEIYKNDRGRYLVPRKNRTNFNHFMDKIIRTTIFNQFNQSREYRSATEAMYELFGLIDNYDIPEECLVVPSIYDDIRKQHCCFVAGRKGSGKSTFIHNFRDMDMEYYNSHYKVMIPLHAEHFNHENAYSSLLGKHIGDKNVIEPYNVLCLFWQLYFVLQCVIIIRREIEIHKITRDDSRYRTFNNMATTLLKQISGLRLPNGRFKSVSDPSVPASIFDATIEIIDNYYSDAIDNIKEDELLLTSYASEFTLTKVLSKVFGKRLTENFFTGLAQCEQKILISLDGFDTHSDDFRASTELYNQGTEHYRGRYEYDELFFRTLVEVITQIRNNRCRDECANKLGMFVDFCVVLPRDKVDIIKSNDRDSFKKKYGNLSWCGLELMEILTKRLEYIIHMDDPSYKISDSTDIAGYFERLDNAFSYFKLLPKEMTMKVGGNSKSMSLFNYILRMSIWRPRDVISNFSQIMTLMIDISDVKNKKWKYDSNRIKYRLNEESIKLILKANADKIIDEEFIGENRYSFSNLDEVLNSFQGMDEQNSIEHFISVLAPIEFNTAYSYDMGKIENKLLVLYQLGIIGLLYDDQLSKKNHYNTNMCFEFNEGMDPFYDFRRQGLKHDAPISIIFNPLFVRRLNLRYNTKELIGDWTREYFEKNYMNKRAIHHV